MDIIIDYNYIFFVTLQIFYITVVLTKIPNNKPQSKNQVTSFIVFSCEAKASHG